jgi:transposase
VETDPARMVEMLVGLPDVDVLGIEEQRSALTIHVRCRRSKPGCPECGVVAQLKDRRVVRFVDLPCFGKSTTLVWHKARWHCPEAECPIGSFTETDERIASPRLVLTDRAGRFATLEVGRYGRSVNEVAEVLGCDWHTVNDAVLAYGAALVDHPDRFSDVAALGLDEVLFVKEGPYHRQAFSTSIVDVGRGQLLDVVPGRSAARPIAWLLHQGNEWLDNIEVATLDLSGTYRSVLDETVPNARKVADPFHVVKLANQKLDECRRRVQNETLGHRGRKSDPLYRCRRLLTKADERLDEKGRTKLLGLLRAGDPNGEVVTAWHAKEAVRDLYGHGDSTLALRYLDRLADDMTDEEQPVEVRSLGRTLRRWRLEITAYHDTGASNGPTEAMNNMIKRVKRVSVYRPSRPSAMTIRDDGQPGDHTGSHRTAEGVRCRSYKTDAVTGSSALATTSSSPTATSTISPLAPSPPRRCGPMPSTSSASSGSAQIAS